ncbi:TolC family protein [Pseudomonas sp. GX19020]|uniref:TolC family protein n=1 Tax=Pseudomonas sp. GX19020 TaxID=2942277 RepID=UPI0020187600|nr:TolC family protein [Pseudomonas sp. GX19020]MCL4066177.1 TolC family protein [Pseudomonas sp. GX19020]
MEARTSKAGQAERFRSAAAPLISGALILALAGCFGGPQATRSSASPGDPAAAGETAAHLDSKGEVVSEKIDQLKLRQSILPANSSFGRVGAAVLKSSQASAESQLRVKRLTARARSKNWLPKLGPDVSLSSLSSIAASLVLDTAIFDRGRRQAERDFAAADVEMAAIGLVQDLNKKVYDGLKLYIEAQRAADLAQITDGALTQMTEFERITKIRVSGGLSDGSEYRLVSQRRAEIEATLMSYRQGEKSAWAELAVIAGQSMEAERGLTSLPPDNGTPEPLTVVYAKGEAARTLAEVAVAKSGLLAGIGAGASVGKDGGIDGGLSLSGDILGFGRADNLASLDEAVEVTRRKVDEADREANRKIVSLTQEINMLALREQADGQVIAQMEGNMGLYTEQYKAGRRSLIELTGQFETLTSMKRDHASLKYQIALARLDIALMRGVLVDGGAM